jgi:hypothetical protein
MGYNLAPGRWPVRKIEGWMRNIEGIAVVIGAVLLLLLYLASRLRP